MIGGLPRRDSSITVLQDIGDRSVLLDRTPSIVPRTIALHASNRKIFRPIEILNQIDT